MRTLVLLAVVLSTTSLVSQSPFRELQVRDPLPTRVERSCAIEFADVDNDGDKDMLVGNSRTQDRLYLRYPGGYEDVTATHLPVGQSFSGSIVFCDIDGDGDLDLAIGTGRRGSSSGARPRLLQNYGQGRFTDITSANAPSLGTAYLLRFADVDGDGDDDLIAGTAYVRQGPSLSLHLNDGGGRFTLAIATHMPSTARSNAYLDILAEDLDGDGDLDLAICSGLEAGLNSILHYRNDGTGVFVDVTTSTIPVAVNDCFYRVAGLDIDLDGDLDLVISSSSNRGPNSSDRGSSGHIYINNGSGHFQDQTNYRLVPTPQNMNLMTSLDADSDGDVDLVFASGRGARMLYVNSGKGVFRGIPGRVGQHDGNLTSDDVDGDGNEDLIFATISGPNQIYFGDGLGAFSNSKRGPLPYDRVYSNGPSVGDVDGDGDLDLVIVSGFKSRARLYRNNGIGSFTHDPAALSFGGAHSAASALGDLDGDGDLDLVIANDALENQLLVNSGRGQFVASKAQLPGSQDRTFSVRLGDLDGDGDLDIVFGNLGRDVILQNVGNLGFVNVTTSSLGPKSSPDLGFVELLDVDSDGDLDLLSSRDVAGSSGAVELALYLNDGLGKFKDVTSSQMAGMSGPFAAGDVDGDGDQDLITLAVQPLNSIPSLYLNDGSGTYAMAVSQQMPASIIGSVFLLDDIDNDGDLDMVVRRSNYKRAAEVAFYINDGKGSFQVLPQVTPPSTFDRIDALLLADLDGDGDKDLFAAVANAPNRLWQNMHRQIYAAEPPRMGKTYSLKLSSRPLGASQPQGIMTASAGLAVSPLKVTGLGTFALDLASTFVLPPMTLNAKGEGLVSIPVPSASVLLGSQIYFQALVDHGTGKSFAFTNAIGETIVR